MHCKKCDHLGQLAQETAILSNRTISSHRQVAWCSCLQAFDSLCTLLTQKQFSLFPTTREIIAKKKIVQDEFQPSMNFPCQVINLGIEAANGNSDGENFRVLNGDVMGSLCPEVLH